MAQYQITVDHELLQQLFLGHSKDAGVAKLLESVLNQILQAQVTEQVAAERYERTDARQGYRNGSYPHQLTTRVGTITPPMAMNLFITSKASGVPMQDMMRPLLPFLIGAIFILLLVAYVPALSLWLPNLVLR